MLQGFVRGFFATLMIVASLFEMWLIFGPQVEVAGMHSVAAIITSLVLVGVGGGMLSALFGLLNEHRSARR